MSKVFLCGDPHGEFDHILSAIDQWHPDAVLILGDLTPSHSLDEIFKGVKGTKIYWIPGNHDTDSDLIYDRLWRSSFAKHNLHGRVHPTSRRTKNFVLCVHQYKPAFFLLIRDWIRRPGSPCVLLLGE